MVHCVPLEYAGLGQTDPNRDRAIETPDAAAYAGDQYDVRPTRIATERLKLIGSSAGRLSTCSQTDPNRDRAIETAKGWDMPRTEFMSDRPESRPSD